MGKLTSFQVEGCSCWFHSNDHRPVHFHAGVSGEWEIRVFFLRDPVEYEHAFVLKRIPNRLRRRLLELAERQRSELFTKWSEKVVTDG